jgi:hypothetical protein
MSFGARTFFGSIHDPIVSLGTGQFYVGGLLFSKASDTDNVFANGIAAATSAADASTYTGYTDWRLPTYTEMQSLVNAVGPAALIAGGWASGTGDWHWTSTLQGGANYYVYAPGQTGGTPTGFSFGTGNYRITLVRAA